MECSILKFKLLSEFAKEPTRKSRSAAGYDLYSAYDYTILPNKRLEILTDVAVELPTNYYGRIAPRSSLSLKHCIDVGAGVIDRDYRGNVKVLLINNGEKEFFVKRGHRIAQLILTHYLEKVDFLQLKEAIMDSAQLVTYKIQKTI